MLALSKVSRRDCLRRVVAYFLVFCMLVNPSVVLAIDPGTDISSYIGDVDYGGSTPGNTVIDIDTQNAIINWTNFNTVGGENLTFDQLNAGSAVLNNISGGQTLFDGNLNANGIVFIVNSNGLLFGPSAFIQARQLVASGIAITDEDFRNGLHGQDFIFNGGAGQVINQGRIRARKVALIGSIVRNMGTILARNGCVAMAAGENVVLAADGSNIMVIPTASIMNNPSNYVVDNGGGNGTGPGTINAPNGKVVLAAGDIFSTALEGIESLRAEAIGSVVFTGDVHAVAYSGSDAIADVTIITGNDFIIDHEITATAYADEGDNAYASVDIDSAGSVIVNNLVRAEATTIGDRTGDCEPTEAVATVAIEACQDVIIDSIETGTKISNGSHYGGIEAYANGEEISQANIDILACRDVIVNDVRCGDEISAKAEGGSFLNLAAIDIKGRQDIIVNGQVTAEALGDCLLGYNEAAIDLFAGQDVLVNNSAIFIVDRPPSFANGLIKARATGGIAMNKAVVDVKACRDVIVDGQIIAETEGGFGSINLSSIDIGATQDVIVSGQIKAEADASSCLIFKGLYSEATVDILAGRDFVLTGSVGDRLIFNGFGQIEAIATDSYVNNASVDITACGDATIDGQITAQANGGGDSAIVNITAGDEILGSGVISVQGDEEESITFYVTDEGKILFDGCADWDVEILEEFICPDCDWEFEWCEECDEPRFVPAAPLEQVRFPRVVGCPAEMQAAATELGITRETLQVAMGDALALNPTIQPCNACARLLNAAAILKDRDGTQIAALARVVNEFASTPAPPSPAQMASIATTLAGHTDDNTHYAAAGEWVDALVEYVRVLNTEMGWSAEESTALAMGKYGTTDDESLTEFVKMRLAALGG